jgi:hypothetical protein
MDMGHDVVTTLFLLFGGDFELLGVEVLSRALVSFARKIRKGEGTNEVGLHLDQSLVRDGQSELLFGFGKGPPQTTPCMEPVLPIRMKSVL